MPVIKENIHIIRTDIPAEAAANEYEVLSSLFSDKNNTFDLVLLGIAIMLIHFLFPGMSNTEKKNG